MAPLRVASAAAFLLAAACARLRAAEGEAPELPDPVRPGTFTVTVKSGGVERTARIHVPKGYKPDAPPPLVMVFHGAGGGAESILEKNGWSAKADAEGFVAVAPIGLPAMADRPANFKTNPRLWNSGQLRPQSPRTRFDDVAFVSELLDLLKGRVPHDAKRVFACGHSNGGGMTFLLAARLSERLAAVATVAGQPAVGDAKPARPLPTLFIYGELDPLMPLDGGETKLPWGSRTTKPVAEYLAFWADRLGCKTEPRTVSDKDGVRTVEYPSKADGGPTLTALFIAGHGHAWPGGQASGLPESVLGPDAKKLNATDVIWEFFKKAK